MRGPRAAATSSRASALVKFLLRAEHTGRSKAAEVDKRKHKLLLIITPFHHGHVRTVLTGKRLHPVLLDLPPPAVQYVWVDLAGLGYLGHRDSQPEPPPGFFLELPGELPSGSHYTILHSMKSVS